MLNRRLSGLIIGTGLVLLLSGCRTQHAIEVAPVEVKPIHITIDINIKVDKALDDFFGDLDSFEEEASSGQSGE